MAATTETEDFRVIIEDMLNRWSGLKLAVEHFMGGRDSRDKAIYLIDYIQEVFTQNESLESEDLEDLLIEYMDNEFQTVFEDDSICEFSKTLMHLNTLWRLCPNDAREEINKLPPVQPWLTQQTQRNSVANTSREQQDDMEQDDDTVQQDDEWTVVSYKKS